MPSKILYRTFVEFSFQKLSERSDARNPSKFVESLDKVLHDVTNNQQAVFGRLELLVQRNDIDDKIRLELEQICRTVEQNNDLISQVKKKVNDFRDG